MTGFPLAIADASRAEQFLLLRRSRSLFDDYSMQTDDDSIVWATKIVGGHRFAVTWLGPGWVFDPVAQDRRTEDLERRRAEMRNAAPDHHRQELDGVFARLRFGVMAERLLWLIHQQVLRHRSSLLRLPDILLADIIWGRQRRLPAHWRQELLNVLNGLTWLHVADADDEANAFGPSSVLLTHVADLHGKPGDVCGEGCERLNEARHHHILINVGRGFLGVLEQFAREEDGGIRSYLFPVGSRSRRQSSDLRRVGKSGHVVNVYLAAKLGDRTACDGFTLNQHRLLQAIVRETTRNTRGNRQSLAEAEVFRGNAVPTTNGKSSIHCELLDPEGEYVGFNGNKLLKGRGYLVASPGGWMAKAGYSFEQVVELFTDLEVLAGKLSLIPVGLRQRSRSCLGWLRCPRRQGRLAVSSRCATCTFASTPLPTTSRGGIRYLVGRSPQRWSTWTQPSWSDRQ